MVIAELMEKCIEVFLVWTLDVAKQHGVFIAILAVLGLLSILSMIINQGSMALKYLFMTFIAFPCIIVVGLFNRSNRKERLKELGEIKSHLVSNPDKWKRMLYYGIFCLLVLFIIAVLYLILQNFAIPIYELNGYTKFAMQNGTNFTEYLK